MQKTELKYVTLYLASDLKFISHGEEKEMNLQMRKWLA